MFKGDLWNFFFIKDSTRCNPFLVLGSLSPHYMVDPLMFLSYVYMYKFQETSIVACSCMTFKKSLMLVISPISLPLS